MTIAPGARWGTRSRTRASGATTLTSNTCRRTSDVRSSSDGWGLAPSVLALFTTSDTGPRSRGGVDQVGPVGVVGDVARPIAVTVVALDNSSTVVSRRSDRRASMTSVHPRSASARASARPSPIDAPVMMATGWLAVLAWLEALFGATAISALLVRSPVGIDS